MKECGGAAAAAQISPEDRDGAYRRFIHNIVYV